MPFAQPNDLVLLISKDQKRFMVRLSPGGELHTHRGYLKHDDLIGQPFGVQVLTQTGYPFLLLTPSIHDLLKNIKRATQIIYPKDIGLILLKLNVQNGSRVIEAGCGSGALTVALAQRVMPTGRVYSYEARQDMLRLAQRNLAALDLSAYVEFKQRDIAAGFDEHDADALFLDVREPWQYVAQARQALQGGGFFGSIMPTTNQMAQLLTALFQHDFADVEAQELLQRFYKVVPERLRPEDRMVAHTGYLVFARKVERGQVLEAPADTSDEVT